MKTQNIEKGEYTAPLIERIQLDNEISLALESAPPEGPNESAYINQSLNTDPFKQLV